MSLHATKGGMKGGHALTIDGSNSGSVQHPILYDHYAPTLEQLPRGLLNVGNTCYANAALQCLLSTALTNALLDPTVVPLLRSYSSNASILAQGSGSVDEDDSEKDQSRKKAAEAERIRRKAEEASMMQDNSRWLTRELTSIAQLYTRGPEPVQNSQSYLGWLSSTRKVDNVVDPGNITRYPNRLSSCLQPYQQEDAHEFVRALLSTLVMNGRNKQLSSLFDGLLESKLTCQTCGRASMTRDRYMDLSLNINSPDVNTIDDALVEYTNTEVLECDNAVFCPKCDKKQNATKGLRLATAPSILVCHLKRFAFNSCGRMFRLHKHVKFSETLEIGKYMSALNKAKPPPYDLVGILVHQGQTCASGHYIAFVKKNEEWYRCNDSVVTKVEQSTVFEQQAYVLMYEVADMRDRHGCTPRASMGKHVPEPFMDEEEAELSKDGANSRSSASWQSSHRSSNSADQQPYQKFLHFIYGNDGITRLLADICCDTKDFREPRTHELHRKSRRRRGLSPDITEDINGMRKTYSSGRLHKNRNKKASGVRSQTAPRQRTSSDFFSTPGMADSPPAPLSVHSDGRSSSMHNVRSYDRSQLRERRIVADRSEQFSRSALNFAGPGDLPPLPRQRAKSTASRRKRGAIG